MFFSRRKVVNQFIRVAQQEQVICMQPLKVVLKKLWHFPWPRLSSVTIALRKTSTSCVLAEKNLVRVSLFVARIRYLRPSRCISLHNVKGLFFTLVATLSDRTEFLLTTVHAYSWKQACDKTPNPYFYKRLQQTQGNTLRNFTDCLIALLVLLVRHLGGKAVNTFRKNICSAPQGYNDWPFF